MLSNRLILCHPLLLPPSIFPIIRVFSSESALSIRWTNYWNFSFNIILCNKYLGLILFRIDWFDLIVVQETLKSFLQHHNLKASILWCLDFFMVQLSQLYMFTGKNTVLTIWTYINQVIICFCLFVCLFFNMLLRFVIAFLPWNKHLLNFMPGVTVHGDIEVKEKKMCHSFHFSPFYLPWDGTRFHDLSFINAEFQASSVTLFFHLHQETL